MRMSARQGFIVPAVIALLVLLANAVVFVARTYPESRERAAAQMAHDRSESDLHIVRQQIRELETVGGSALAAHDDLRLFLDGRLLDSTSWSAVTQHVRNAARDNGVTLERVDHSVEAIDQLGAERWQMSVFGAGSYASVRAWMSALGEGPGLMFVDRAEIGGAGGPVLSVELTLVALLRSEATAEP
jgi:type II secretory pathway component PulM